MANFVHTPATTAYQVEEYQRLGVPENEHLDFKREFWAPKEPARESLWGAAEEACSDVVAFMNHLGGDIIVGIQDGGGRAGSWALPPEGGYEPSARRLRDWLNERLEPREAASTVAITTASVKTPQGEQSVLMINVPPWPHGIVFVTARQRRGSRSDRLMHVVPIREGADTRYLEIGEAMRWMNPRARAAYIALQGARSATLGIAVQSAFRAEVLGRLVVVSTSGIHHVGSIRDLKSDSLNLELQHAISHRAEMTQMEAYHNEEMRAIRSGMGEAFEGQFLDVARQQREDLQATRKRSFHSQVLEIPLAVIKSAHIRADGAASVILDGTLVWSRGQWSFEAQ